IVIDPRATETAQAATQHIALRPKGDLALYHALAHCILRDGRTDPEWIARTEGFEEFARFVRGYEPAAVTEATGLDVETIERLAETVSHPGKRVSWWWTMGINQSYEGVRAAQAIINLCLITGNIGKPGTGPNSITGQCNAMGSRLFSNTTSLVGGHDFENPEHRTKVAGVLGIPQERIPAERSLAYDQILAAAEEGRIKGLWIVATNPFHSWVDSGRLAKLREKLDFLVVQDMYHSTESARVADLVLPAAGWGEKDGCFINSERRIGTLKAVRRAPGLALSDFRILRLIAHAWGCGGMFSGWTDPEAVFRILRDLTEGRPCDITGIDGYAHLDAEGGIQWPFPRGDAPRHPVRERRLFEDGVFPTPSGKARMFVSPPAGLPEEPNDLFPFLLLTGRGSSSQWHTLTRTGKSDVLAKLCPQSAWLEMHPDDVKRLGLRDGARVRVSTRRGTMEAALYQAPTVRPGQIFLPMHFPEVNTLTHPSFDPHSRQPNYKACAARVDAETLRS
ncbi:MAG: molybdopterin oxidoreductase family protein, partial [Akkermansiaceae bacterium]|nr:molybdopterin oxidoreductase family protein [Akkermansiaceae bacterium]